MLINIDDFLAGYLAGAAGTLVGHPLDTIKTVQQATNKTIRSTIYDVIVKNNGIRGFYRGMQLPILTQGILQSIVFGVYGNLLSHFQSHYTKESEHNDLYSKHIFISGCIAGLTHTFIACPIELIKVRLQTQPSLYTGVLCGQKIYANDGFKGFYRGWHAMVCRDVIPYGIYMVVYNYLMKYVDELERIKLKKEILAFLNKQKNEPSYQIPWMTSAGAIAGVVSWIISIPFDVVKTILQAEKNKSVYNNMIHCIHSNIKLYGWKILFRGSWVLIVRAIPVNAAIFYTYDYFSQRKANRIH